MDLMLVSLKTLFVQITLINHKPIVCKHLLTFVVEGYFVL